MNKTLDFFQRLRPKLTFDPSSGPSLVIELDRKMRLKNEKIEERINQLDSIKDQLVKAADAIDLINNESKLKKRELELIKISLDQINHEKETAEKILTVDKESFSRLLISTNKKTERRSVLIGLIIGFVTGTGSSLFAWWLTIN